MLGCRILADFMAMLFLHSKNFDWSYLFLALGCLTEQVREAGADRRYGGAFMCPLIMRFLVGWTDVGYPGREGGDERRKLDSSLKTFNFALLSTPFLGRWSRFLVACRKVFMLSVLALAVAVSSRGCRQTSGLCLGRAWQWNLGLCVVTEAEIATSLRNGRFGVRIPAGRRDFSLHHNVRIDFGTDSASYSTSTGFGFFPMRKVAGARRPFSAI